jgi:hypothetical protein
MLKGIMNRHVEREVLNAVEIDRIRTNKNTHGERHYVTNDTYKRVAPRSRAKGDTAGITTWETYGKHILELSHPGLWRKYIPTELPGFDDRTGRRRPRTADYYFDCRDDLFAKAYITPDPFNMISRSHVWSRCLDVLVDVRTAKTHCFLRTAIDNAH